MKQNDLQILLAKKSTENPGWGTNLHVFVFYPTIFACGQPYFKRNESGKN